MTIYVNKTLSVVGCAPEFRARIRAASTELTACGLDARCMPWDGTRRDLVFVDPSQPIGESAFRISLRRGTRVIVVGRRYPDARLDEDADDERIGTVLREALGLDASCGRTARTASPARPVAPAPAAAATETESEHDIHATLLAQLAAPIRAGRDFWLKSGREAILVRPDAGMLFARQELALGVLRAQLLRNLWSIEEAGPIDASEWPPFATSLESFLVDACLRLQYKLPHAPCGARRLTVFPDLGALAGHPDMLRVARAAMRGFASADALAQATGVSPGRVHALLWAMHVAGLLEPFEPLPQAVVQAPAEGSAGNTLWRRMARRFGLVRDEAGHA